MTLSVVNDDSNPSDDDAFWARPSILHLALAIDRAESLAQRYTRAAGLIAVGDLPEAMTEFESGLGDLHRLLELLAESAQNLRSSHPEMAEVLSGYTVEALEIVDRMGESLEERDFMRLGFALRRGLGPALVGYRQVVLRLDTLRNQMVDPAAATAGDSGAPLEAALQQLEMSAPNWQFPAPLCAAAA